MMTSQASGRGPERPTSGNKAESEPSLPERLLQALSARAGEAGQPNAVAAGLLERFRSGSAAVRAAAPESLNPSQMLMNRLRPSRILEKAADQELRPLGFGLYGAIAVDFIARQASPPRLADISRFLMQEPQSLTTLIHRLERRGWLRREPSLRDRRAVLLELTEAGRQLHQRIVNVLEALLQDTETEGFGAT
jgi:DNA-binding MarR family transcriptional regulator